jgi:hypothetical protein
MTRHLTRPSRRRFLRETGGFAALAATIGAPRHLFAAQTPALRIRAVDAYPIYINQRRGSSSPEKVGASSNPSERWLI